MVVCVLALAIPQLGMAQTLDQQKAQAQQEVDQLQMKVEAAVESYKAACDKLSVTKGLISDNQEQLTEAQQELAARQSTLNQRVRAMYVSRPSRMLDVLVNATDFSQVLVGLDFVKKVGQQDAGLVRGVKDARARLESKKQALADQKGQQEATQQQLADAKANVDSALVQSKGKLSGIEQEIQAALARRLAEAQAASRSSAASSSTTRRAALDQPTIDAIRKGVPPGSPHPAVVNVALDQLGKPYVWGATGPDSFDCSGLTTYCYAVGAGMDIPRSSYGQANLTPVSVSELQPGDIVGFHGWGHVGMYIGNDQFIQAPSSGDVVKISSLSARGDFCGAVRP